MAKMIALSDYVRVPPDMTPAPSGVWYAVVTKPNGEHAAADALRPVCRVHLPVAARIVAHGRGKVRVSVSALFPRYLFVASLKPGMFPFFALRGRGVETIVRGQDGYPFPIPDAIMAAIREREEAGDFDSATPAPIKRTLADHGLARGQQMRVTSGAFEGWIARIDGMSRKGAEARCLIDMLGRAIWAEIPLANLDRVA